MGPLLHAVIPHHHNHGQEATWSDLHASLRHEEKKALVVRAIVTFELTICIVVLSVFVAAVMPRGKSFELLSRGIHQYRRFG